MLTTYYNGYKVDAALKWTLLYECRARFEKQS